MDSTTLSPPVAVVSLSGVFPKATGCDQFWQNIVEKVDAAREVPAHRWVAPFSWVTSERLEVDKAYSRRACLVDAFDFDPSGFDLSPSLLGQLDPLSQWVLHAAKDALGQTDILHIDRKRMGVILAAIALPTEVSSAISRTILGRQLFNGAANPPNDLNIPYEDTLSGRVVGFPSSIVSRALGLGGVCYTLDAACASSLYAIKLACDELQSYRSDAMIAGGVSRPDCLYTQVGFSQLRALSPSGRCAPFDQSADGLVVGEGTGLVVLKRLDDALSHGDTIYGVIRGIGISNDMRGNLLAPESDGQLRAMKAAYKQAQWRPYDVDHIECHGAGTPVGDATELESLTRLWGSDGWAESQCAIGSIKSMIGHLLTAAGAAGMIKTLLALHHKILPPSLNFTKPKPDSPLFDGPLRVQTNAEPWNRRDKYTPRKAAVSAFGFGGINAHVLVEEWSHAREDRKHTNALEVQGKAADIGSEKESIAIVGMGLHLGSLASLQDFQVAVFNGQPAIGPVPAGRWKAPEQGALPYSTEPTGNFIEQIVVELGEFQIPPGEIPDILPQQLLMLQVASSAMKDAGLPLRLARERMGTIIGISFDYEAANFHLRWALPKLADQWKAALNLPVDDQILEQWLLNIKDDCGPPLTAARTLGALGGIVASRIAREFRFGGPSFVVSAEEASGLTAVSIAMRMLQSHEVDTMLAGAVDLNGDERNMATLYSRLGLSNSGAVRPFDTQGDGTLPGEGAVALVLKRFGDAKAHGDRIYAVIEGMGAAAGNESEHFVPDESAYAASLNRAFDDAGTEPGQIELIEVHGSGVQAQDRLEARSLNHFFKSDDINGSENPIAVGTLTPVAGHTGSVSGLASLVKSALSLNHHIIPPAIQYEKPSDPSWQKGPFHFPLQPVYWAHNRLDGPRHACISSMTSDGNCMHAVLRQTDADEEHRSKDDPQLFRPMGSLPCALFVIQGESVGQLLDGISRLEGLVRKYDIFSNGCIDSLAWQWYAQSSYTRSKPHILSIVSDSIEQLETKLASARSAVEHKTLRQMSGRGGICYIPDRKQIQGRLAFVYPGSGNHYIGMGRTLGAHWPEVLREMNAATDRFKSQLLPRWYDPWRTDWSTRWDQQAYDDLVADPLRTIFGQVLFGGQLSGLLKKFSINPQAVIGYSLGESAGLFAMGAWPDRGQMLERLESSDLFKTQLTGPCKSLRRAWQIPKDQPIEWKVAAINRDAKTVDRAIDDLPYVRRLIVNTPSQCVIGGLRAQVQAAVQKMECTAVYLDGVTTVHCDGAKPCSEAYKDLHLFSTTPVDGVTFYSCAHEKAIQLTAESAAESITLQAVKGFDFPRTVEQAYDDGIRIFLEIGPHCSCTTMIDQILDGKPHLAVAANHRSEFEPLTLLKCLGTLAAAGVQVDLEPLYGSADYRFGNVKPGSNKTIQVPVGGRPLSLSIPLPQADARKPQPSVSNSTQPEAEPDPAEMKTPGPPADNSILQFQSLIDQFNKNVAATAKAHEQFLELSQELTARYGETFNLHQHLLSDLNVVETPSESVNIPKSPQPRLTETATSSQVAFDRAQCMEFAIGSVGKMLGPEFEIIDTYDARVRLPDEPLMLVDRIVSVEGEKCSLGSGKVVTEHDVLPEAWYLDGNRAPVCISVEAGQADLFLCSYLGIDHQVKGLRTYRLLDAKIRFHRGLPQPGETIRYQIHIDKFVRQEETYLFFFRFEGHIGQEHLITMTDGCAGFFTEQEVRNSGGIILTEDDKSSQATLHGAPYTQLIPQIKTTYDDAKIDALRNGDIESCFGSGFNGIRLPDALCLPGDRMRLIHRILDLDPEGGRFGKGMIKAEADIHPDDWFLTCHFVDDQVMPGTLMYECCAHALRVLLLRMGWITDEPEVAYEPVQGIDCRLKCRGPVTPSTRHVHYVVEIKEIAYCPEPSVLADAHMYADGQYIVFFKDMSMQMTNVTQEDIQDFWKHHMGSEHGPAHVSHQTPPLPLYTHDDILEFSVGRPSKSFGEPYAVFDAERIIARLPGPPYCFMDRITSLDHQQWVLKPQGWVEAQYDVPQDAWYFEADGSGVMPFCVLLEIALQPCGWLAAYSGSALKSERDLKFRNLGGQARLEGNLYPARQTLTMRARLTKVSEAADMIIENFDFQVLSQGKPIYTGTTYFGFFTAQALSQQVGLREAVYAPSEKELACRITHILDDEPPVEPQQAQSGLVFQPRGLKMPSKALCMIDGVDLYCPDGGPHGLGYLRGYKLVDPREWFFKAHFYQDPVCPGSLGVESFLQLLKYAAMERWPQLKSTHRFEMTLPQNHQWSYRGQVIPDNEKVMVEAVITHLEEGESPIIVADGCLQVDGIYIYKMEGFGLRLVPI